MGRSGLVLRREKPESPMSQLDHSRRFCHVRAMSARPPIATEQMTSRYVSKVPLSEVAANFSENPDSQYLWERVDLVYRNR